MPYRSDAQRRFMHARHPEIARRWDEEERMDPAHRRALAQLSRDGRRAARGHRGALITIGLAEEEDESPSEREAEARGEMPEGGREDSSSKGKAGRGTGEDPNQQFPQHNLDKETRLQGYDPPDEDDDDEERRRRY